MSNNKATPMSIPISMRLSSPVGSPTASPIGSPISSPIGTKLGMLVQTPTVDLGDDTDVTYQTVDKGPKKINQYILGEKLGQGIVLLQL